MRKAALALSLTLLACGRSFIDGDGPPPVEPAASAEEVRALDGLRAGDSLATAKVVRVGAVDRGMMPVVIEAGGARARFDVCLFSPSAPGPPVHTERYAIYFTSGDKGAPQPPSEVMTAAAEALAARLRKVEASVAPPPGVTTYATEKKTTP
ncbi:MAG: hypothetical protein IT374_06345 [Polyangiaceae bacterium]|nr:hypothetical protein [Polyangiaceae bacterium]